jgi:hypothetical protein
MNSSIIVRRVLKVSLISVSVAAGLVVGLATLVIMGFSATSEKALEVSQGFEWEEIPATILESGVLAPIDGGELDYCEEIPSTVFCEESGTNHQPETAPIIEVLDTQDSAIEPETQAQPTTGENKPQKLGWVVTIPKNATKEKLRQMVTELGLEAPLGATKAQLTAILRFA